MGCLHRREPGASEPSRCSARPRRNQLVPKAQSSSPVPADSDLAWAELAVMSGPTDMP